MSIYSMSVYTVHMYIHSSLYSMITEREFEKRTCHCTRLHSYLFFYILLLNTASFFLEWKGYAGVNIIWCAAGMIFEVFSYNS